MGGYMIITVKIWGVVSSQWKSSYCHFTAVGPGAIAFLGALEGSGRVSEEKVRIKGLEREFKEAWKVV